MPYRAIVLLCESASVLEKDELTGQVHISVVTSDATSLRLCCVLPSTQSWKNTKFLLTRPAVLWHAQTAYH